MEREGLDLPLLIGGATTSRVHTAVKIHPAYERGQAVYVADASRAVGVVSNLLSAERKPGFVADLRAEYARLAEAHARAQEEKVRLPIASARANRLTPSFDTYRPVRPSFLGTRIFRDVPLAEVAGYIDWTPFFQTWELQGRFPEILDDPKFGEAARGLYEDATRLLRQIVEERWLEARAVVGFWPAEAEGDDIVLFTDEGRRERLAVLHTLRQQMDRSGNKRPNLALADFVAPAQSGIADYVGAFAVTAGIGEEEVAARFQRRNDDYSGILAKALADRLAEAMAEYMHARVRRVLWGYAPDEALSSADLIAERYQGIRPAPGYPAQPDHTEKGTLFRLLGAEEAIGLRLTESYAMWPGSAVSGLYFAHPESRYFGVGKIDRDQVIDYARRKFLRVEEVERWLMPVLNYDPAAAARVAAE
jgi:5-methyltetrahydrofolate--homocysteine methyltransferase